MFGDWIDILLKGSFEVSIPTLTVTGGEVGTLTGSGRISWNTESGIRVHAVTNGADILFELFPQSPNPGHIILESSYVTFSGGTQRNWEFTTDPTNCAGYQIHSGQPHVVWDLNTEGITLRKNRSTTIGGHLRILMAPSLPIWVRSTETEVRNDVFGRRSGCLDWLTTTCSFGRVSARKRSDDWFEVLVKPDAGDQLRDAPALCVAVWQAFSFVLGRKCAVRGYEENNATATIRRLDTHFRESSTNTLLQPLGFGSKFLINVERLLGLAIDFFLTDIGRRVAPFLQICWDAADNSYETQLVVCSICIEGLLRLAAKTLGPNRSQIDPTDLDAFRAWLRSPPPQFSRHFLRRLEGYVGMVSKLSANEIFRDWIDRGVLGVTRDDLKAWRDTRHPSAHGDITAAENLDELQSRVFRHARIQNLLNKIVLQLMGYTGDYIDYAQDGHPAAKFPAFSEGAAADAALVISQDSNTVIEQAEAGLEVELQSNDLPADFKGWAFRCQISREYNVAFPNWARLVADALHHRFPGALVVAEPVDGDKASTKVEAPEGTPDNVVARVSELASSVEKSLAQRIVRGGE